MDKKQERKIRINDLKETYKILKNCGDDPGLKENIHSKELQTIKNAIKFLENENKGSDLDGGD